MKTLMMGLILVTMNAVAADVKIYEALDYRNSSVRGEFKVNEEMGRAWVELTIAEGGYMSEGPLPSYERVKVEGLSLVGGSIVFNQDGKQIECAKMKTSGIFRTRLPKETGNCKLKTVEGTTIVDDGFETRRVATVSVYLVTKDL